MAKFTILRIYEVPAENRIEASERMMEALLMGCEKDFHIKDIIRDPGAKAGEGKAIVLRPPAGWLALLVEQLTGGK